MSFGVWQILILAIVILVLFGRGRISEMMGDFGKGISSFKKGMTEEDPPADAANKQIEPPAQDPVAPAPATPPAADAKPAEKRDSAG